MLLKAKSAVTDLTTGRLPFRHALSGSLLHIPAAHTALSRASVHPSGRLLLHSGLRFRPREENVPNEFGEQPHLKALNQSVRCIGESSALTWQSQCVALAISAHCIEKGNMEPRKGFPRSAAPSSHIIHPHISPYKYGKTFSPTAAPACLHKFTRPRAQTDAYYI